MISFHQNTKKMTWNIILKIWMSCLFILIFLGVYAQKQSSEKNPYIVAVKAYAENVLAYGKDTYGPKKTSLFIDGINIDTRKPVTWSRNHQPYVISNFGSQQNLLRTLVGLSALTEDQQYKEAAVAATRFAFENVRYGKLMAWGGHIAYDASVDSITYAENKSMTHELKCNYPFYEFLWEINPTATREVIENTWNSHILDWSILDFNRHGKTKPIGTLWKSEYIGGDVFFKGNGLTFINAASDFYYAAALLSIYSEDPEPLVWAKRLARRYVETRNPKTGIGGYLFSTKDAWITGPDHLGDRAAYQFGDMFPGHQVLEATLFPYGAGGHSTNVRAMICQMVLFERLGEEKASEFKQWPQEELTAWGKSAYRPSDNKFIPMLTDGTNMEGVKAEKPGYFEGTVREAWAATELDLWAYALAYKLTKDPFMLEMVDNIGKGLHMGSWNNEQWAPNLKTKSTAPEGIFAFLDLYEATHDKTYLKMAQKIGDNILSEKFNKGFFTQGKDYPFSRFDDIEPLALLHLAGSLEGNRDKLPIYPGGRGFFHDNEIYARDLFALTRKDLRQLEKLPTILAEKVGN